MKHAVEDKPLGRHGHDLAFALLFERCYKRWIAWNPQDPSLESAVVWLNRAKLKVPSGQRKNLLRRMVADRADWIESWGRATPHAVKPIIMNIEEMRMWMEAMEGE